MNGSGATDNSAFTISGNQLLLNSSPNFENQASYSIRIRTTDQGGLFFDKVFSVNVNNVNETPTDIALSANTVNENVSANTVIGSLSSTDPDTGNTFSYSLVNGSGATDNSAFRISGNQLLLNNSPNFENQASYSIRIRSTDQGGLFFDKIFTVNVNDWNEAPVVNQALSSQNVTQYQAFSFTLPNNSFTDPDAGDHLTLTATLTNGSPLPAWLSFSALTGTFSGTPGTNDTDPLTIKVVATDTHGLHAENSFNLSINPQSNTPPILSLGQRNNDAAYAITALNTGNILVAGYSQTAASSDFILLRYTNNGQLDPQFSGDGKTTTSFSELDDISRALAVQTNGKIIVVGSTDNGHDSDFALARYHSNGRLDTSFGNGGKITSSLGTGDDDAYAVSVVAGGKIIVAGTSDNGNNSDFALIRYNTDGSLDTSFSNDGKITTDFGASEDNANAMRVQTDGKILVSGTSHGLGGIRFALARYNSDGSLDTSFNDTGKLTTSLAPFDDRAYALSLQEDGKILVAGESWNGSNNNFAVVRYLSNGQLDDSFANHGKLITALNPSYDSARAMQLQSDGKIVVAGFSTAANHSQILLIRYNSDGSLDTSFGNNGKTSAEWNDFDTYGYALSLQTDGKILVAGTSNTDNQEQIISVARFNTDGSLDRFFTTPNSTIPGASAIIINSHAHVYDAELAAQGHYQGAYVTLMRHGGNNPDDHFVGSGKLSFNGNAVLLSGVNIGNVSQANGALTIIFNNNATQDLVDETLSAIAYNNTSATPPDSVSIDWLFSDGSQGGALTSQANSVITLNVLPTLNTPASLAYTDTPFVDHFAKLHGKLKATGVNLSYGIDGGTDNGNGTTSLNTDYGKLTVNQTTGAYVFIPKKNVLEALGTDVVNNVTVTVTNNSGSDSKQLTITITQNGVTETNTDNTLLGSAANDEIAGLAGDDIIKGLNGNDTLKGGSGQDTINGGLGQDNLTGGVGIDSFIFSNPPNNDIITDFTHGLDILKLDSQIYTKLAYTGVLKPSHFALDTPHDKNDYFIYDTNTGVLSYDADGSGKGASIAIVTLGSQLTLSESDIFII